MTPIDHSSQAMLYQIISAIWLAIRGVTQWLLSKDFISMFLNYRHGDLKKKKKTTMKRRTCLLGLYPIFISLLLSTVWGHSKSPCLHSPLQWSKVQYTQEDRRETENVFNYCLYASSAPSLWTIFCTVKGGELAPFQEQRVVFQAKIL